MKKKIKQLICIAAMVFGCFPITAYAASTTAEMAKYPGVTVSPDGSNRAWTTDYGDRTDEMLPDDYTIETGIESSLRDLQAGEHYYNREATGSVPIGKWVVIHSPGHCIHDTELRGSFAGFAFESEKCGAFYNNGWFMYCADCGEPVLNSMIYAKSDTVKNITSVPAASVYVYLCPYCDNLEQGVDYQHLCKNISYNRYRVTYRNNAPADSTVAGYMAPTLHMYENSAIYNGKSASEMGYTDTGLRKNSLSCLGYIFVGWNTKSDGSGQSFSDGQEILNLTTEENGTVRLYAQWKKSESTLVIDAAGGTYNGQAVYEKKQSYDTTYKVDTGLLTAPIGYTVSFVTNGGTGVNNITTTKHFSHWELGTGFQGEFTDNVYRFQADNGHRAVITAQYIDDDFTLPGSTGSNVSLVGWYDDPALKDEDFVGKAGDKITVSKDTVLYAKWAQLTLWSYEDYDSYGGAGAVDLNWEQKDGKSKYYRLFQSLDKGTWKEIFTSDTIESSLSITTSYTTTQKGVTYTIPYTGNYTITANGGKGADYNASLKGGNGGSVSAAYWLIKGDVITVYPGSSGSGLAGGTNGNGLNGGTSPNELGRGGGAASQVTVTRNGTKTLLLTAGGGGGANGYAAGGAGGTGGGNGTISKGADGIGGGGAGDRGGIAGVAEIHTHTAGCKHVHSGTPGTYGGCYTSPQACGSTSFDYSERQTGFYYGNIEYINGKYENVFCVRCGSYDCPGHAIIESEYRCKRCGTVYGSEPSSCTAQNGYGLGCGRDESYICGYSEGQIIKVAASTGGTNYIANVYGCKNQKSQSGVHNGDGTITISSLDIGYVETNRLDNVKALDMAAPYQISAVNKALSGEKQYRIMIEVPEDNGTTYYHRVESYENGTITKIADSNVTENILVSGIAGYRYYVDGNSSGTVTAAHSFTGNNSIDVNMKTTVQYLHIAAVDVAGNIGPTTTVAVPSYEDSADQDIVEDYVKMFPPMTDKLVLVASDYVYDAGSNTYFVKADGETQHMILVQGYLNGNATKTYQVDTLRLVSTLGASEEWYQATVPKVAPDAGDSHFSNEELLTSASKETLSMLNMAYAAASRTGQAGTVKLTQYFSIGSELNGSVITVYPRALAEFDGKEYESDVNMDKTHGITLIPDGEVPVIHGVEALENAGNINMTERDKQYTIYATDEVSGVRKLTVTITNRDNHMTRTYTSDTGSITITMSRDDYLFLGDFSVAAEAVDFVGNHGTSDSDKTAFTLEADVQRKREPKDADYKAGDGAVLTVTTSGYADKVIIRFPDELVSLKPDLNKEYVYEFLYAVRTETYEFNIPLLTPEGTYVIEVEAWKNGEKLTKELELPINASGSITEEFRTRIRDNGV